MPCFPVVLILCVHTYAEIQPATQPASIISQSREVMSVSRSRTLTFNTGENAR